VGVVAGAGIDLCPKVLHDDAPVRLLLVADLDHVDFQVNVEDAQRQAMAKAVPHCPAPVSVDKAFVPASLL
jgi:hypothetical protein